MDPHPVSAQSRRQTPGSKPTRRSSVAVDEPAPQPWFTVQRGIIGLVLILTVAVIAYLTLGTFSQPAPPSTTAASQDQRAVAVAYVDVQGGVRSLFPTQPGRVKALPVPEGKEVPEGTILLQLDDEAQRADLASAELALDAAQERLLQALKLEHAKANQIKAQELAIEAAREKMRSAEFQAKRVARLYKEGVKGGSEDVDSANALVKEAQKLIQVEETKLDHVRDMTPGSAVRLAEVDVEAKHRQIDKAQVAVDGCKIKAPSEGKILRSLVNVGELLGPNAKIPALQFCPSENRIVRAEVEQEFASKVFVGQKATIQDDVTGKGEWAGEVIAVSDWYTQRRSILLEPMQFNDVRTLEVVIRLKDKKAPLRINQRVRVRLDGADL